MRRPTDPGRFSGVVVVEWFNVTSQIDLDVDFKFLSHEILRSGHAWVGVTAQAVSLESNGTGPLGPDVLGLIAWDSARYESLYHPGDAYSYDIYSQVGATLKAPGDTDPLAGLKPEMVLADGESQSAFALLTYVNAIHSGALVYDGFLIHSRAAPDCRSVTVYLPLRQRECVPICRRRSSSSPPSLTFMVWAKVIILFPGRGSPIQTPCIPGKWPGQHTPTPIPWSNSTNRETCEFDSFYDLSSILASSTPHPRTSR